MEAKLEQRPWGFYRVIESGLNYKVKEIWINQGHRISLQSHQNRKENWSIISGEAGCEIDNKLYTLRELESIIVPKKSKHRITNIGDDILKIIEVQLGDCKESDISRFQDDYGRSK